jgi:hypothetical protein
MAGVYRVPCLLDNPFADEIARFVAVSFLIGIEFFFVDIVIG